LCNIKKTFKTLEESELNPEAQEKKETSAEVSNDEPIEFENKNSSESIINPTEIKNIDENEKVKLSNDNSLFKRVLENGFDGITTNPNYKLLALLIILLINLSLFFLVGNLGKTFLKNSGILG